MWDRALTYRFFSATFASLWFNQKIGFELTPLHQNEIRPSGYVFHVQKFGLC